MRDHTIVMVVLAAIGLGFLCGLRVGVEGERQRAAASPVVLATCEKQIRDFEYKAIARLDELLLMHPVQCEPEYKGPEALHPATCAAQLHDFQYDVDARLDQIYKRMQ